MQYLTEKYFLALFKARNLRYYGYKPRKVPYEKFVNYYFVHDEEELKLVREILRKNIL